MGAISTHLSRKTELWWKREKKVEEGKDWQAQTDREWRLKWQRDKQAGAQREWGGEKWTAAMKQETEKRWREGQADSSSYQTRVDSPWGTPARNATDKKRKNKTDIRYELKQNRKERQSKWADGAGVWEAGAAGAARFPGLAVRFGSHRGSSLKMEDQTTRTTSLSKHGDEREQEQPTAPWNEYECFIRLWNDKTHWTRLNTSQNRCCDIHASSCQSQLD